MLSPDNPSAGAEFATLWPIKRMPVLRDGEQTLMEASIIIEHLDRQHSGPVRLLPEDPKQALRVRFIDRVFDNYIMTPMQRIVADYIRSPDIRDPHGVADARKLLDTTYQWLETSFVEFRLGLRRFQPGRLRRGAVPVLCRLGAADRGGLPEAARLSRAPVGAAILRTRGGGGAAVSPTVSTGRTGSRLSVPNLKCAPAGRKARGTAPSLFWRRAAQGARHRA